MDLNMRSERGGGIKNDSQSLRCATMSTVVSVTTVGKTGRTSGFKGKDPELSFEVQRDMNGHVQVRTWMNGAGYKERSGLEICI